MEWIQILVVLVTVAGLFIWNRAESRADSRHYDAQLKQFNERTEALISAIKDEMRDFHGRLCAIEERRNKFIFKE